MIRLLLFLVLVSVGQSNNFCWAEFPGWQGLRVIEQKGKPSMMRATDLDGDGREELIVVNSRSSRLDIYAQREQSSSLAEETPDSRQPNELPLAPDWEHRELQLDQVPRDVQPQDLDGDGQPELVVLVTSPNRILVFRNDAGEWESQFKIELQRGEIASRQNALLVRPSGVGNFQALVSIKKGIQQLFLEPGGQAEWLTPREQRARVNWWLADLDGDGQQDLVEQTREAKESIRWYRTTEEGTLNPAAVLHDRAVNDVEILRNGEAARLAVIDGNVSGVLRLYQLELGEASRLGRQRPLALDNGHKAVWCGMKMGDKRALVVADSDAPRLLSYVLGENGWQTQRTYPALTDIRALAPLASEPDTLLLWAKDSADLYKSQWESGRLTYPEPWSEGQEVEDRKILALQSVGPITWWVQRVGKDLDLYVARPEATGPQRTRFPNVGTKADEILWLGGERLLVKQLHGRELKLLTLEGDKAKVSSPTHLKKAAIAEFKLFLVDDDLRVGRVTEGVLQWLGEDLQAQEQVMLPQGQELADYVPIIRAKGDKSNNDGASGWALQNDSPYVHRIAIDASSLSKSVERVKLSQGTHLVRDPVLGLLLLGHDRVTHLDKGQTAKLKLVDVIDDRVGRAGGVRKTRFHRLASTDIDRDGYDDLVLFDELQHRITVLGDIVSKSGQHSLKPKIAWPVFDDKVYPYNDESDNLVKEPRAVLAADFDGDKLPDMAILSHDRLILYLAREQ